MSRLVDEKKTAPKGKARLTTGSKLAAKLVAYNPSTEEKNILKIRGIDLEKDFETLSKKLEEGHRISLGYNVDKNTYFCMMREGNVGWEDALSVSVWGSTLERVVTVMAFYLKTVNPEFPQGVTIPKFDDDW